MVVVHQPERRIETLIAHCQIDNCFVEAWGNTRLNTLSPCSRLRRRPDVCGPTAARARACSRVVPDCLSTAVTPPGGEQGCTLYSLFAGGKKAPWSHKPLTYAYTHARNVTLTRVVSHVMQIVCVCALSMAGSVSIEGMCGIYPYSRSVPHVLQRLSKRGWSAAATSRALGASR